MKTINCCEEKFKPACGTRPVNISSLSSWGCAHGEIGERWSHQTAWCCTKNTLEGVLWLRCLSANNGRRLFTSGNPSDRSLMKSSCVSEQLSILGSWCHTKNGLLVGWAFVTQGRGDGGALSKRLRQTWRNGWEIWARGGGGEVPAGLRWRWWM